MARPHKQMPVRTYHIEYCGDSATIECTYLYPYCEEATTSNFTAGSDAFDMHERDG